MRSVASGGSAAVAGVRPGDIIVAVNGADVTSLEQFELMLSELKPGTKVTIRYTRGLGGTAYSGTAALGALAAR